MGLTPLLLPRKTTSKPPLRTRKLADLQQSASSIAVKRFGPIREGRRVGLTTLREKEKMESIKTKRTRESCGWREREREREGGTARKEKKELINTERRKKKCGWREK